MRATLQNYLNCNQITEPLLLHMARRHYSTARSNPVPRSDGCPHDDVILATVQSVEVLHFDNEYWFGNSNVRQQNTVRLKGLDWKSNALDWFGYQQLPQSHHLLLSVIGNQGQHIGFYSFPSFTISAKKPSDCDLLNINFLHKNTLLLHTAWNYYESRYWDVWRRGGLQKPNWWTQIPEEDWQHWQWISANHWCITRDVNLNEVMMQSPVWHIACEAVFSISTFYFAFGEALCGNGAYFFPHLLKNALKHLQHAWTDSPIQLVLHNFEPSILPGGLEILEEELDCSQYCVELVLV